jgi:hypothetical protein
MRSLLSRAIPVRGLTWEALVAESPPALWPLVTLARHGASEAAVLSARDAIAARNELDPATRAEHLAVLWFAAEAEHLPVAVMRAHISEVKLMERVSVHAKHRRRHRRRSHPDWGGLTGR